MTADLTIDPGETGDVVHVLPLGDLITHESRPTCICGPRVEDVERDDGTWAVVVVHNSLDGREQRE